MKFYGIDCLGYFKVQEVSNPTWTSEDDRRLVQNLLDDRLYVGSSTRYIELVQDRDYTTGSWPTLFKQGLDATYHPKNGTDALTFKAASYSGITGEDLLRVKEPWVFVSDGVPLDTNNIWGGLLVETSPAGDAGINNAAVYYAGDAGADPNGKGHEWRLQGPGYSPTGQIVATREWVSAFYTVSGDLLTTETTDLTYYSLTTDIIDTYTTIEDSHDRWVLNSPDFRQDINGSLLADQMFASYEYTGTETDVYGGTEVITGKSAYSVVRRSSGGHIKANIGYLTATSAQYADLAEIYTCDEDLPIGTVVEVSDEDDYEVVPCMFELSPAVVGVVSDNPAHVMNSDSEGLPIGLTGKVQVRIVGEVRKQDFIVSAGNGLARKGEPSELVHKMGIALETSLQSEEKLVYCIIK